MIRRPRLSPGRLTALWTVLRTLARFGGTADAASLKRLAARTSLRSGGLPIEDGYVLALAGRFITEGPDHAATLAFLGTDALDLGDGDEPNSSVIRLLLSVLMLADPPPWVAFWQGDPDSLDLVLPYPDRRLLASAELLPPPGLTDLPAWTWWDALSRVPVPEDTSAFRKVIGDAGEQLSLQHERERLTQEGFPHLARAVRWVARESPAYGFDVASFWGKGTGLPRHSPNTPDSPLAIEVKSLAVPAATTFSLYLSLHEWNTAQVLSHSYLFHLWDGVNPPPNLSSCRNQPIILTPLEIADHLPSPSNCGQCAWETAHLNIPINSP